MLKTASDLSDMFAGVMTGLEELRHDMTKRMDLVKEIVQKGQERLRDELIDLKSQARIDHTQLIRDTDQCLAENLALASKESQERDVQMTREIERLLNDHDKTYAHTMTNLVKRLDAKADIMMRKLDEILSSGNRENRHAPTEDSRQTTDGAEPPVMQGLSRDQEPVLNLTTGRDPGQTRRGRVGRIRPRQRRKRRRGHRHRQCHKSDRCQI